jgi:hypothetical protein
MGTIQYAWLNSSRLLTRQFPGSVCYEVFDFLVFLSILVYYAQCIEYVYVLASNGIASSATRVLSCLSHIKKALCFAST